ncbi:hypothetical protein ACHAQJ_008552 [Trichoderma viride]
MFVDDLLYIRAQLSTGVKHPKTFSPSSSANTSTASTPDNRSISSQHKSKRDKLRNFFNATRPETKMPMHRGLPIKMM